MTPEARLRIETSHSGPGQATAVVQTRNLESHVEQAISRSRDWMLAAQAQEGYWWGELEADTTLESDYILYLHILGQLKSEKTAKLARYIRERQLDDGGWNIFYGGPSELNATVKAYVALRLAGDPANRAAHAAREAKSPRPWRPGSHEFLRAVLSRDGRRDRLGHGPVDSARDDAACRIGSR